MKRIYLLSALFFVLCLAPAGAAQAQYYQYQVVTTPYWCGSYYSSWPCNQQPAYQQPMPYYPYTNYNNYSYYPYNYYGNYGYQYSYQNYYPAYNYSNYPYYQNTYCPLGYYSHENRCYPFPNYQYYNYGYPYYSY